MISERIERLAARFWEEVGTEEPFPRNLELPIQCARMPLSIRLLPGLCPRAIQHWLQQRGHRVDLTTPHRWLNGCLYANDGMGFLFVDAGLSVDHRRVVTAHEFAHFLVHYDAPRRRVERRLGRSPFPVLDGRRTATEPEQLAACLAGVSVDPYIHFMDRAADGVYVEPIEEVERTADELGLELLAPWRQVFASVRARGLWPGLPGDWENVLQTQFGLPGSWASHYAMRLLTAARGRLTFCQALGL